MLIVFSYRFIVLKAMNVLEAPIPAVNELVTII